MARRPEQVVQISLRIREDMRKTIEKLAKREHRTLNGQLVALLDAGLRGEETERQFAELKDYILNENRKLVEAAGKRHERDAVAQELFRLMQQRHKAGVAAPTDAEIALEVLLEEMTGGRSPKAPPLTAEERAARERVGREFGRITARYMPEARAVELERKPAKKDEPS